MHIKLLRSVLVGDADITPTRDGTVIDLYDTKAREFIAHGLAVAHVDASVAEMPTTAIKAARAPRNKMRAAPENKAVDATPAGSIDIGTDSNPASTTLQALDAQPATDRALDAGLDTATAAAEKDAADQPTGDTPAP